MQQNRVKNVSAAQAATAGRIARPNGFSANQSV
jgi:hypothetical protein